MLNHVENRIESRWTAETDTSDEKQVPLPLKMVNNIKSIFNLLKLSGSNRTNTAVISISHIFVFPMNKGFLVQLVCVLC